MEWRVKLFAVSWFLRRETVGFLLGVWGSLAAASARAQAHDLTEMRRSGVLRHLGVPYANFVTGSGDGFDVELIQLYASSLGLRYEYVKTDWSTVLGDLTGSVAKPRGEKAEITGHCEVKGDLVACGMTVLAWRKQVADFSEAVFPTQVWLVAPGAYELAPIEPGTSLENDISAVRKLLAGRSIFCKAGTCLEPSLYNLTDGKARFLYFSGSLNELAPAIMSTNRVADLTLLDVPDTLVALQKWPGQIKVIGPISPVQEMAVAFRKDSRDLRESFNRFLAEIKRNGAYKNLIEKYYPFVCEYYPGFFKGSGPCQEVATRQTSQPPPGK